MLVIILYKVIINLKEKTLIAKVIENNQLKRMAINPSLIIYHNYYYALMYISESVS